MHVIFCILLRLLYVWADKNWDRVVEPISQLPLGKEMSHKQPIKCCTNYHSSGSSSNDEVRLV